ncbi:MAG TPA: hypothetical protein H9730_09315, partial [Candidatus Mediterraneibacter stercoripullorum]|nr:hypothetical protein [Candidatus Mediterraneibacter stercoripullorum]
RLLSFFFTALLAGLTIGLLESEWIAYGIFMFMVMTMCHALGWQATISVNAVIGTHFLVSKDFGNDFIINELLIHGKRRAPGGTLRKYCQRREESLSEGYGMGMADRSGRTESVSEQSV